MNKNPVPAIGVEGHLIYGGNNNYYFRVYDKINPEKFTDYSLVHSDLCLKIVDEDAYFYGEGESAYLDHSPQTLGIDVDNDK